MSAEIAAAYPRLPPRRNLHSPNALLPTRPNISFGFVDVAKYPALLERLILPNKVGFRANAPG